MTSNQLKLLAFACMVADHASKAFLLPDGGFSNIIMMIGRISFPIFAFCIAQGYLHTSNIGLYQWRLLLFGILAQPFYITCLSLPVFACYYVEYTLHFFNQHNYFKNIR